MDEDELEAYVSRRLGTAIDRASEIIECRTARTLRGHNDAMRRCEMHFAHMARMRPGPSDIELTRAALVAPKPAV